MGSDDYLQVDSVRIELNHRRLRWCCGETSCHTLETGYRTFYQQVRTYSKDDGDVSEGHKAILKGLLLSKSGTIWDNLSIKMNDDSKMTMIK